MRVAINIESIRAQFPSLAVQDAGVPRIYFDNPGGTQTPRQVIDRMVAYLSRSNANCGGAFQSSVDTDAMLDEAHRAAADFVNASDPDEIAFGQNMSSLAFSVSRALARRLSPGDAIVVTHMDHDANISPWLHLAQDLDLELRWLEFDPARGEYDLDALDRLMTERTRIVAVNHASNVLGTINDVKRICAAARAVGAISFVDSVQYAPHGVTDVREIGCDFLAFSAYKVFGPHQGVLWARRDLVETLDAYKVRPGSNQGAQRFEIGTLSHEGVAGMLGAFEYLAWIGDTMFPELRPADVAPRRAALVAAMRGLFDYETTLTRRLIAGLERLPGVTIHGVTDPNALDRRVPTVSLSVEGRRPETLARRLAADGVFVWSGHNYALGVIETLGLAERGGVLRIGMAHYNTVAEVDHLLGALDRHLKSNDQD